MLPLFLLPALLVHQQAPETLLPLPAGWRHERLDFPLDFAPELGLAGIEDLAFAPGMFTPDSDSYFSYALALRLDGDVEIDAAFLENFLAAYYRGLCRAVAGERHLELDLDSIAAKVRPAGAGFRGHVALFDPFNTGEAFELELELTTHVTPRATELLGLASPLDAGAPIWKELHALGATWLAARPAPLFLNHLYRVVDRETFAALEGCKFLREELCVSERRDTVRADRSYTGLYFYGQRTYFEFLPPEAQLGIGSTGIGFGLERAGATEVLQKSLGSLESEVVPITRLLDKEQVPWFRMLSLTPAAATSSLGLFTMEYEPAFLERWHPAGEAATEGGSLRRRDVLERYASVLKRESLRRDTPLGDVVEVELEIAPAEEASVLALCAAAGYELEAGAGERTFLGPEFRLHLRASEKPGGITGFTLGLRRRLEHEPLELGAVRVAFEGDRARVTFRP